MANGANGVHLQLREALEDYIKSQYFGKSPILLSAVQNKLDQEGILYQKPYIESSPAYKSELNGIQKSSKLPDWVKAYFDALANADLGGLFLAVLPSGRGIGSRVCWKRSLCFHGNRFR